MAIITGTDGNDNLNGTSGPDTIEPLLGKDVVEGHEDRDILIVDYSGVAVDPYAGASVANGAGLQRRTVRNMALAWVLTLPAAMLIAGGLYWLLLTGIRIAGIS